MLVADRIVGGGLQHSGQVALFEMPNAVLGQEAGDLAGKLLWRFKVIEHRDRRHEFGATTWKTFTYYVG